MSISAGQPVSAAVTNAAFLSRLSDSSTVGVVSLENTTDVDSGDAIDNAQQAINETFDAVGMTGIDDATRKNYSSNNIVANGDSHKVAIGKLDAHEHVAGDVAVTPVGNLAATDVQTALEELQGDIDTLSSSGVAEFFHSSTIDASVINGSTGVDVSSQMTNASQCLWQLRRTSTTEWLALSFTTTTTHVIFDPEIDVAAGNYTLIGMGVA